MLAQIGFKMKNRITLYQSCTDIELVYLISEDNHEAYREIYNRYAGVLYLHARRKLNDREEARDLIQELFISLWNNRNTLTLHSHLSAYLYRAIRYKIINILSRKKLEMTYMDAMMGAYTCEPTMTDHQLRENELKRLIEKEVNGLPPKMRKIFHMSRQLNFSHREIAEKLDLSEATVKKQVNNALKVLRIKLGTLLSVLLIIVMLGIYKLW